MDETTWHRWGLILNKSVDWTGQGPVMSPCEHGNESFDSIKGKELFWLAEQILAPWTYLHGIVPTEQLPVTQNHTPSLKKLNNITLFCYFQHYFGMNDIGFLTKI